MDFNIGVKAGLASAVAIAAGSQGAMAEGFDGFYAGVSVAKMGGQFPYDAGSAGDYQMSSSAVFGAFFGHNWAGPNGLIIGVELAYQGKVNGDDTGNADDYNLNYMADAKLRVGSVFGTPIGQVLGYGFAGFSRGQIEAAVDDLNAADYGSDMARGVNFGLGAELAVTDNVSLGLEYIRRSVDGYIEDDGSETNTGLALRAAFRF